ncbi:M48 family metallopeptidase [Chryseobacterium vrystaatense]|uniref:Zn-dependent protease with chaperone function n=1 Tax=Chryseobacterium vrystaatense TaxID=307480 RepID=A0A1M5KD32_9FLAO|nr:M48 family metallopeptidase [Chryseobacterium vrystaatense]SHG50655.1 Zn-dependent protease with chaperone function [Chryseobacterium vrystaatense]
MYIQVSEDFKKKSKSAVFAIAVFIIVYILMFLLTVLLAFGCIAGGIWLIAIKPMFLTIMLGAGLAGTGGFIFFFIIKFLFKRHINDLSYLTEIKRTDEPELFKMIDDIVQEAGTDFPKKVYLSYDVNASVFYDSSFWSMFYPIKKNLTIGLGLINTSTKQELKAVLSHEFGHFSQRSMKVGSYVYNVNKIIFNLVNDDQSYRNSIEKWAGMSGYFSIFALLSLFITHKIQWILTKMYSFVNIRHMALSREMEFHADEVAANIAGSLSLEESLLRMELANNSYQNVITFYEERISKNKASQNIYKEQFFVMNFLAKHSELESKYDLPHVKSSESGLFNKSKLNIENQWASHPSNEDRIARLQKLNIIKDAENGPAKNLFVDFEKTEIKLTAKLFSNVKYQKGKTDLDLQTFISEFEEQYSKDSFDKIFNGYYDNKNPDFSISENTVGKDLYFDQLFSKEKVEMVYILIALESDKKFIEAIIRKEVILKTFDYDGKKYNASEAGKLIPQIDHSIAEIKSQIHQNDSDIYSYFLKSATDHHRKGQFENIYRKFAAYDNEFEARFSLCTELSNATVFITERTPVEQISKNLSSLKPLEEQLKKEIFLCLNNNHLTADLEEQTINDLKYYLEKDLMYFNNGQYIDSHLQLLMTSINMLTYFLHRQYFLLKKELLSTMKDIEDLTIMQKLPQHSPLDQI